MIKILYNYSGALGLVWILYWFIVGVFSVGDLPENANEPYPIWLPFALLFTTGLPFILGWLSGYKSKKWENDDD